jgi:hypothetical protein
MSFETKQTDISNDLEEQDHQVLPREHDEREDEPVDDDVFRREFDSLDQLKDAIRDDVGDQTFDQIRDVRVGNDKDIEDSVYVWQADEDRFYVIRKLPDGRCWIVSVESSRNDAWNRSDAFVDGIREWLKK